MTDIAGSQVPADLGRIDISKKVDLEYWAKRWDVSQERIENAVKKIGTDPLTVRSYLGIAAW